MIAQANGNAERNGLATAAFIQGDVAREVRPLLERVPKPTLAFVGSTASRGSRPVPCGA